MRRAKWFTAGLLLLFCLVLIVQNTEVVAVRFLAWELEMSRVVLLLLALATGFAAGYLVGRWPRKPKQGGRA